MSNEATKAQIKAWLEEAIKKAQNPDPREKLIRERERKKKDVLKHYGL
jgi:hypothetical protein